MTTDPLQISAIKSPFDDGYLGLASGRHIDGTPLSLTTVDESGNMAIYESPDEAIREMERVVGCLKEFKFKRHDAP